MFHLREAEALLDHGGELTNASTLLAKHVLCASGPDDDLGADGGRADLDAGVTLLSELAVQELEFGWI